MKKISILLAAALLASGCSIFPQLTDKIVDGVDEYCTRLTPAERSVIRANVNDALAEKGHSIAVSCAGDD